VKRVVAVAAVLLFAGLLSAGIATSVSASISPSRPDQAPTPNPPIDVPPGTIGGPVSYADRVLIEKVRQAGLWEIPTGQQAQQRASSEKVKEVGRQIAADHAYLDEETIKIAQRLGVVIPSQASPDQQRWMAELSTATGPDYDRKFADLLRAAHGSVFSIAASVRAGTRNDMVRQFAGVAIAFVHKHMTILEGTGLVSYGDLPEPVLALPKRDHGGMLTTITLLAVAGALALGGIFRVIRGT